MGRKSCTPKGSAAANAVTASALFAPRGPGQATPHETLHAGGPAGEKDRDPRTSFRFPAITNLHSEFPLLLNPGWPNFSPSQQPDALQQVIIIFGE